MIGAGSRCKPVGAVDVEDSGLKEIKVVVRNVQSGSRA